MCSEISQGERRSRVETALGPDVLNFVKMEGEETLSGLFRWEVEVTSANPAVDLNELLGTHSTVIADCAQGTPRYFDGIVSEARCLGNQDNGNIYAMVLRPWLHVASLRRNHRIFHHATVIEILTTLFADYASFGSPHFEDKTSDSYPTLEYTVQFGESDADFAMRLMERFGITWHWTHDQGCHTLVLTDYVTTHDVIGERPFYGDARTHLGDEEHFRKWETGARMTTGAVRLTEYNFKTPTAVQQVEHTGNAQYQNGQIESFDWPGDYLDPSAGQVIASRRAEAEVGQSERTLASGNTLSLGAGMCVALAGDEVPNATGRQFVCLRAKHSLRTQAYRSKKSSEDSEDYEGQYVLMPVTSPLRPEQSTKIPRVHGPQTAEVVGEGEIDCDEYGRILVKFHWDLESAHSMRCRVSQSWASKGWGGMVIPRVGMEVIVEFLEGDPDKPVVTGCVYNGKNNAPYPLPTHKTKSVFRSDTHTGEGFNELYFEDQAGEELIYMHGQKDQKIDILNDRAKTIGRDQSEIVGQDHVTNIGRDHSSHIGNDLQQHVHGSKAEFVGGDGGAVLELVSGLVGESSKFMKKHGSQAGGPVGAIAGELGKMSAGVSKVAGLLGKLIPDSGVLNTVVSRFRTDTVGMARSEQIGLFKNTVVGHSQAVSVGVNSTTVIGEDYDLEAKGSIFTRTVKHTAHATQKFVIAGPGGSIEIGPGGVEIKGTTIKLKGSLIDMSNGSPNSVQLKSDKPYNQDCE